jgi:hypothetical protein
MYYKLYIADMKTLFGKLFQKGKANKSPYAALENALSDVGIWNWWVAEYPDLFMIEVSGAQIWNNPVKLDSPPSGQIAMVFQNPASVCFIERKEYVVEMEKEWYNLLHDDKLETPSIEAGSLTFDDEIYFKKSVSDSINTHCAFGKLPKDINITKYPIKFVMWAGNCGCLVVAESVKIRSHDGDLTLEEVNNRITKWWDYWKEYWEKRSTENPLPKDYACEVTIPVDSFKFNS